MKPTSSLLSQTRSSAPSSGTIAEASAFPSFAGVFASVAGVVGAGLLLVFAFLLPHAVIDTTKDSAAIRTSSFLNFIKLTPPKIYMPFRMLRKRFHEI
ncbi:hypothetical protein D3C78_1133380 [compost metagenome]